MPGHGPPASRSRGLPTFAVLGMIVGLVMVMAGFPPPGAAGDTHVTIAATVTAVAALDSPMTKVMARQSPRGMGWQGSSHEVTRGEYQRHGKPSGEPGSLRTYLLRSAAVAHRSSWIASAVPPDFS
jgi:hypothetical protein